MAGIGRWVAALIGLQMIRGSRKTAAQAKDDRARILRDDPGATRGEIARRLFRLSLARQYAWTDPETGRRSIGWRLWLLIWLLPGLMALGAAFLAAEALLDSHDLRWTEGEVVQVYSWPGETFMDRDKTNHSPVIRFTLPDGTERRLTPGMSHPDWNHPPGTVLRIGHRPDPQKVWLPGFHNWAAAAVVAGLSLALALPAGLAHLRARRWLRGGA